MILGRTNSDKAKTIVETILTEFGMIDSLLRSVYKQHKGTNPVHPDVRDGDLDKCFFDFLESHPDLGLDTKNKNHEVIDGTGIHLKTLLEKLRGTRNIVAHQTWSLSTQVYLASQKKLTDSLPTVALALLMI